MDLKGMLSKTGAALARRLTRRGNRVSPDLSARWEGRLGAGQEWMPVSYGEYYPRSALVYSALKIRQDAVARVPLRVLRRVQGAGASPSAGALPVAAAHPAQRLLDSPNAFWSGADLWRATETYLGLWGSAFWGLERDGDGRVAEIWPLRPDRVRVVPDPERYIRGFVYVGRGQRLVPYVPEDMVWLRYFNPLDEYAGLSPIAPLRLSADMGLDALRASRNNLSNDSVPGLFIETDDTPTETEVEDFYKQWEARYRGVERVRRPALLSAGMKAANIGFSPRDMEYVQTLRWSLEDVCRVYGVPKAMLGDIERITFSNFKTARRVFWQDTIVPQLTFFQESLEQMLLPNFGDPSLSLRFDISGVEALQETENDKASWRRSYVSAGVMTINEVRREMELPPVEWGDAPLRLGPAQGEQPSPREDEGEMR